MVVCGAGHLWAVLWVVPVVWSMVFGLWWCWRYRDRCGGRRDFDERLAHIEARLSRCSSPEGGCETCGRIG